MLRRFLQHAVVLGYLGITLSAFVFTMTKVPFPLPLSVIRWSYGMMAPYQGDVSWNADFLYEGQLPDGTWENIGIDAYMPYGFGERNVRKFLRVYELLGKQERRKKFNEFALQLLDHERERGKPYTAMRVLFDQWDRSPAGYEYLHMPLFTKRELVTQIQ